MSSKLNTFTSQDKFGFKAVYMCLLIVQLITALSIYHFKDDHILYTICVALAFTCEGGHFSTFPAAAVKIFGMEKGGQIFTLMFFSVPLSSLSGFALVQMGDSVSPKTIFFVGALMTLLNIVLLMIFDDQEM